MEQVDGTVAFFRAMAPVLPLTHCDVRPSLRQFHKKELKGEEEGHLTYLWLNVLVFLFMLYGLYTWGTNFECSRIQLSRETHQVVYY